MLIFCLVVIIMILVIPGLEAALDTITDELFSIIVSILISIYKGIVFLLKWFLISLPFLTIGLAYYNPEVFFTILIAVAFLSIPVLIVYLTGGFKYL